MSLPPCQPHLTDIGAVLCFCRRSILLVFRLTLRRSKLYSLRSALCRGIFIFTSAVYIRNITKLVNVTPAVRVTDILLIHGFSLLIAEPVLIRHNNPSLRKIPIISFRNTEVIFRPSRQKALSARTPSLSCPLSSLSSQSCGVWGSS